MQSSISTESNHAKTAERRVGLRPAGSAESESLGRYFRDLDGECLLNADEEIEAAQRILRLRKEYWSRLLEYAPFLEPMLDVVEGSLGEDRAGKVPLAELRKHARARHQRSTTKTRRAEAEAIEAFAMALADADPSCDVADVIAADVESISSGSMGGVRLDVRQPRRNSTPFRRYVQAIQRTRLALQAARRDLARANLRLVVTMAHHYRRNGRMSLADLIQEGNVGLMTAVDWFDPRRGYRFSTYGSWWIRHSISRALSDKGRAVRLPVHMIELQTKLARLKRKFEQEHQRGPDSEELAELASVPKEKIERFGRVLLEQDSPASHGDAYGGTLGIETVPDEQPDVIDTIESHKLDGALGEALETLRPMEADILRMRFGLDDAAPMTLREIGDIYSLSRERIRQIQERALGKLRAVLESEGFDATPEVFTAIGYEA